MEDLEIVAVEGGYLELAAADGSRFRLAIDDRLQVATRRVPSPPQGVARQLSPKEIQAALRGGMTAADVAAVTGAPLEYIQRYEGPIVAERDFVISSALAVPVHTAAADPLAAPATFGDAILERLHIIGGVDEQWSAWKEASGWVVKLGYDLGVVEHDARWHFDPKRQSLSPINAEAVGLSRVDAEPEAVVPRLRAVVNEPDEAPKRTGDRFDSGAFLIDPLVDSGPVLAPLGHRPRTQEPQPTESHNQTADLLEALRRRRGEREPVAPEEDFEAPGGSGERNGTMRLVELDLEVPPTPRQHTPVQNTGGLGKPRKGRPQLPSWDEIVFGARPDDFDDDLA